MREGGGRDVASEDGVFVGRVASVSGSGFPFR